MIRAAGVVVPSTLPCTIKDIRPLGFTLRPNPLISASQWNSSEVVPGLIRSMYPFVSLTGGCLAVGFGIAEGFPGGDFCRGLRRVCVSALLLGSVMVELLKSNQISFVPDSSFMQIVQVEKRLAEVALPDCQALDKILRAHVRSPLAIQM